MNELLARDLDELRDIGIRIAELSARSKEIRNGLAAYYTSLTKRPDDDATAIVFMRDHGLLASISQAADGRGDFHVTFAACDCAGRVEMPV